VPLIPPALDDRSYSDLVQDLLASIPAHTPEWTVQQPGDPGRTLIELFSWLADSILYRANLIPERQRLAFLKLLGLPLQPAAPARGIVTAFADAAAATAVTLAAGASVPGPVNFETLSELDVLPVIAQAYVKAPLTTAQNTAALPLLTGLMSLYNLPAIPSGYATVPVFANNMADPGGVDIFAGTIDQCLWIALLAQKPANRDSIRENLAGKNGERILSLGLVPAIDAADPFGNLGPAAPISTTYQISADTAAGQPLIYLPLTVAADTTSGLTRAGVVQLVLPQGTPLGAPANDVRADSQAGVGPKPPRIDDPDIDAKLVGWIRVHVTGAVTLNWAGVNAVEIDQRTTFTNVVAGVSDGTPQQKFALAQTQIDPATFQLEVDMPGLGYKLWNQFDDLSVVQGPSPAYVLDPEAGTVTFGNQMQGLIPPAGRRIRVRQMRAGGGAAGNLAAATLTAIKALDLAGSPARGLTLQQPVATTGGAEAEFIDQALQRIPATLRHKDRAVTAGDYKDLVQQMPGGGVARVEVLPLFKPQTRNAGVPGVVSVMVIPPKNTFQPPNPRADRPLLERVYAWLDPKRPVAAEMYVIGTEYIGLGLSLAIEVRNGFGMLQVAQQVEHALRVYLWPAPPGGPNGAGWPLGRTVRSLELEVIASQVPGVVEVNGVDVLQPDAAGAFHRIKPAGDGNAELTLHGWQLPELLRIVVSAGPDGSGIMPADLTPQLGTDNSVAVPIVPALC
jgi:hypothetical protein